MNLFDILNNISNGKKDISDEEDFEKEYNPFMINRFLAMDSSTLFFANEATKMSHLPKKAQYLFLFKGIDKKKRYFKYAKGEKNSKSVKKIAEYYQVNEERALEMSELLSKEKIKEIENIGKNLVER